MNEPRARRTFTLIAGLIIAAGAVTWLVLSGHNPPTPGGTVVTTPRPVVLAPPPVGASTPSPAVATSIPVNPKAVSAGGEVLDTASQDQRQLVKITRGLTANPAGGILVESLPPGSVASLLRVQAGDVIVSVNGKAIASPEEFARIYREQGLPRQMTVIHNGREMHRH